MKKIYSLILLFVLLTTSILLGLTDKYSVNAYDPQTPYKEYEITNFNLEQELLTDQKISVFMPEEASLERPAEQDNPNTNNLNAAQKSTPHDGTSTSSVFGKYPETSIRILTREDLEGKNTSELKIMRNEIFARHSYLFSNLQMQSYFTEQPWYKGIHKDVYKFLTKIEKENLAFIKQQENDPGRR